jgi:hypothetical protein
VQAYEQRADEIGQGLDEIDVEELKDYVLNSHYRVNSRPASRPGLIGKSAYNTATTTDLKRLDDFTALVTATILQALPYLSRLNRLLDLWTIRLLIHRNAPKYLSDLNQLRVELDKSWDYIRSHAASGLSSFNHTSMATMKSRLEYQVSSLGRRLDRFLDDLAGRQEVVPDAWLDEFEQLEQAYASWVTAAETKVLENELRQQRHSTILQAHDRPLTFTVPDAEDALSDEDAVRRPSQDYRPSLESSEEKTKPFISPSKLRQQKTESGYIGHSSSRSVSMPLESMRRPDSSPRTGESQSGQSEAGHQRSSSSSSIYKEESIGQVAKRRAALLRNLEQGETLNKSKPSGKVRSFEHASNAFTRLFQKNYKAEPVFPPGFSKPTIDERSPLERKPLSSLSRASTKFNDSTTSSLRSGVSSSKSSINEQPAPEPVRERPVETYAPAEQFPNSRKAEVAFDTADGKLSSESVAEEPTPETYQPSGRTNPTPQEASQEEPPHQDPLPDEWPLATPDKATHAESESSKASAKPLDTPARYDADYEDLRTPSQPFHTDVFDRMFIETLSNVVADGRGGPTKRPKRRASAPRSPKIPSVEGDVHTPSPSRPRTAPAAANRSAHSLRRMSGSVSNLRLEVPGASAPVDRFPIPSAEADALKLKRASVASIEAFPRSELKSIDVRSSSRSSSSTRKSPSRSPRHSRQSSAEKGSRKASPDHGSVIFDGATAVAITPARRSSLQHGKSSEAKKTTPLTTVSSPNGAEKNISPESPAPLNVAMKKLRGGKPAADDEVRSPSERKPTHEDPFDRHVSEVLERLPAPIRFKSRPGAVTPVSRAPRAKNPTIRPQGRDITIAPAESTPRKSRSAADIEVKLYHLTQSGRDDPIKLYIRIVGEGAGERVMVRVGGGWADLADYLRDFASHHGSRTVSESHLEVQSISPTPTAATPNLRKASGPAEFNRVKTPTTPKLSSLRPGSSDSEQEYPFKRPPFDARSDGLSLTPISTNTTTTTATTPKSAKSIASSSRPSSRQGGDASSSASSSFAGLGLSGPISASKDLPEDKARWVEGMLERAKRANVSAEKAKDDRDKYFGELSKSGSTRRVVFRPGSSLGVPVMHAGADKGGEK